MTKDVGRARSSVRFKRKAVMTAATMPSPYIPSSTPARIPRTGPRRGRSGMKAAISRAYTGSRAEHVMNGVTKIVARRSRSSSMVRAARMAGTAQAYPESSGRKARPWRPTRYMVRSAMTAARAM